MVRLFLFITTTVMSIALIPMFAQADNFKTWTADLRVEAQKRGVSDAIFDAALGDAKPLKRVIELDRSQPEFTLTRSRKSLHTCPLRLDEPDDERPES